VTIVICHGLVGNASRSAIDQAFCLRCVRGEMKIGKKRVMFFQHRTFASLWLFDLNDHIRLLEHFFSIRQNLRSDCLIFTVVQPNALPGRGLNVNFVSAKS